MVVYLCYDLNKEASNIVWQNIVNIYLPKDDWTFDSDTHINYSLINLKHVEKKDNKYKKQEKK